MSDDWMNAEPTVWYLSAEVFDKLLEEMENPSPPTQKLIDAVNNYKQNCPWKEEENGPV